MKVSKVTILGSGTSAGVPVIGCDCSVCSSEDPKNQRYRASLLVETDEQKMVIDTSPEFRLQMVRAQVKKLDAVFFTHTHADHCHGFDDLRAYFFYRGRKPIDCYIHADDGAEIQERFAYAFRDMGYPGVVPQVDLKTFADNETIATNLGFEIETMRLPHGPVYTSVLRIGNFAYATDFKSFSEKQIAQWRSKVDVLVVSGIHFRTHTTHSTIPETLELIEKLEVKRAYITHLSHEVDYQRDSERLPANVEFAYDNQTIDL